MFGLLTPTLLKKVGDIEAKAAEYSFYLSNLEKEWKISL